MPQKFTDINSEQNIYSKCKYYNHKFVFPVEVSFGHSTQGTIVTMYIY
jgi:hypothetical protein